MASECMRADKLCLKKEALWVVSHIWELYKVPVLGGAALPLKEQVCCLGVLLVTSLLPEVQMSSVTRSDFYQLCLVHQLKPFLDRDTLPTLVRAVITSRLDYCNAFYVGLPMGLVWKLHRLLIYY